MIARHLALVQPAEGAVYNTFSEANPEDWKPANPEDILLVRLPAATERDEYPNENVSFESDDLQNSFLRFINARSLGEMLAALDACFEIRQEAFFTCMHISEEFQPVKDADKVAAAFYGSEPTKTQREHVEEVLKLWGYAPSEPEQFDDLAVGITHAYKLADVIQAKRELYNHGLLLAYCSGKPSWDADFLAEDIFDDDRRGLRFPLIDLATASLESPSLEASHLRQLLDAPSPVFGERRRPREHVDNGVSTYLFEMERGNFNAAIAGYAEGVFNSLSRNDCTPFLYIDTTADGKRTAKEVDRTVNIPVLYQMWWFLREGIPKPPGAGSITVCRHCKRLFMQTARSKSKEYCSDSCRVMEHRKRHKEESGSER